jgi:hypothetical protein
MRLRATCHACEKDFLFFELYNADPADSDRCPRCRTPLGIPDVRRLMLAADQAALSLFSTLEQMKDRAPGFSIQLDPWLPRLEAVASSAAGAARASAPGLRDRLRRRVAA